VQFKKSLGLILGLVVGLVAGYLFSKSQAPEPGTLEDKLELAQQEAAKSTREANALKAYLKRAEASGSGQFRRLARDLKDGKDVSFDDILGSAKPWMRQVAPVMERVRKVNEVKWADARVSEWTRNYTLTTAERNQLREYFKKQSEQNAEKITDVINSDQSGFVEFVQATDNDWRDFEGTDDLMEGFLEGEELEQFQSERLQKRVKVVQEEADRKLGRLDEIVALSDDQQAGLFRVMVRGSEDYRPEVNPDDYRGETAPLDRAARDAAIDRALTPDQRQVLDEYRGNQVLEMAAQFERYQLVPPKDFDLLEGDIF
jgi:Spy/CpxP family protein refolding chaperone